MNEVKALDARELSFIETEGKTIELISSGIATGKAGYLSAWAGMAVLLYRSHESLRLVQPAGSDKKAKAGLPQGYITRLSEYLAPKVSVSAESLRQYLSTLNNLVDKSNKNADASIRAICSNGDAPKLALHLAQKGFEGFADIRAHATRNNNDTGNKAKPDAAKRVKKILEGVKPAKIVEGLQSMPNANLIFDLWSKARAKASGKRK